MVSNIFLVTRADLVHLTNSSSIPKTLIKFNRSQNILKAAWVKKFTEGKIYCPVCEEELVVTHQDRYQDLSDHVSNPNGKPSLKDGYQCVNKKCFVSESFYAWIYDGDFFCLKDSYKSRRFSKDKLMVCSKSGESYALNSFNHYYHFGKKEVEKKTKKIRIWKYGVNIIPKEYGWNYPEEKRYMPKPFSWKFEYWVKTGEYTYQSIVPHHRMIAHCVGKFNRTYERFMECGGKSNLSECLKAIDGLDYFDQKDDRFFIKASSFIIRIFHPVKCSTIKRIAKEKQYEVR